MNCSSVLGTTAKGLLVPSMTVKCPQRSDVVGMDAWWLTIKGSDLGGLEGAYNNYEGIKDGLRAGT